MDYADTFRQRRSPIMVSTNAFGMGIDKPNIRWTIHVTQPSSIEAFAQEAGRSGRNGASAYCWCGLIEQHRHLMRTRSMASAIARPARQG